MKVETSADIEATPQEIYDVVMDPRKLKDWVSIHDRLNSAPDGALRKGSELSQSLKLAGRSFKVEWTVVENDRPSRVVWEGKGPLGSKAKVVYDMSDSSDGVTHFSYFNEYDLPGGPLGKFAGPAVKRVTKKELDRSIENLQRLLK